MNLSPTRHPLWTPLLLLLLVLPILLALIYFDLATQVFHLLGVSPRGAMLILGASLIGSLINIPLTRRQIVLADSRWENSPLQRLLPIFYYHPPAVTEEVLALNVGGAVVPVAFSAYLLAVAGIPLAAAVAATTVVTIVVHAFARLEPGTGITVLPFIPPLVAAFAAHVLVRIMGVSTSSAAPVAYIAGTLGTLTGADLLNLPRVLRGGLLNQSPEDGAGTIPGVDSVPKRVVVSIGGAGIFDGIFLTSIIAPLLA